MKNFIERNFYILPILVIFFTLIFSLMTLTTKPRLWYDEGLNIEVARNISYSNIVEAQIAPNVFSEQTVRMFQATGYPVTIPLAIFFKVFGFGAVQARLYMLLWVTLTLFAVLWIIQRFFGKDEALLALLLIVTFAPFHDNGRTVIGEIPGFFFLLTGFYFLFRQKVFFMGGLLFGLAAAAKISVYLALIPALFFYFIITEREAFYKNLIKVYSGMAISMILEIFFVMAKPFSVSGWREAFALFKNPFGESVSPFVYIFENVRNIPQTTTLVYFFLIVIIIGAIIFYRKHTLSKDASFKHFIVFSGVYSLFAFLYYLKSPGWLRYLIAVELLILILLPVVLKRFLDGIGSKRRWIYCLIIPVVIFQGFHLITRADIFYSKDEQSIVSLVGEKFQGESIGVFNIPQIGAFIPENQKYQFFKMVGVPLIGKNPLLYDPPIDVLIIRDGEIENIESNERKKLEDYHVYAIIGRYYVYLRNINEEE